MSMRLTRTSFALAAGALVPLVLLVSCAESEEPSPVPPIQEDASAETATIDAETTEADVVPNDASVDADARRCSAEGFCRTDVPTDEAYRSVWNDGQGGVWMVSESGNIRSWDGTNWTVRFTASGPLYAIWGSSPTDIWAGGANGMIHGTGATPATLSWTEVAELPGDPVIPIFSIWGSNAEDVWAAGGNSDYVYDEGGGEGYLGKTRLLHFSKTDDAGAPTWTLDPLSTGALYASSGRGLQVLKVWGDNAGTVWLGGNAYGGPEVQYVSQSLATAFQRKATDSEWAEANLPSNVPENKSDIMFFAGAADDTNVWTSVLRLWGDSLSFTVVHADARTVTDAPIWTELAPVPEWFSSPNALWATSPNDIWYAGSQLALHFDGAKWNTVNLSVEPSPVDTVYWDVWAGGPNDVWIVGNGIAAHKGPQ